jgi:hypothetical protein
MARSMAKSQTSLQRGHDKDLSIRSLFHLPVKLLVVIFSFQIEVRQRSDSA